MLDARDLTVTLDGLPALRAASLSLGPGERLGVVGESGCGKTMLALALMGMLPDAARASGSLRLDGDEMIGLGEAQWRRRRGRRLAMVFQEPMAALNPLGRIGATLVEPLRKVGGLGRAAAQARARALLAEVGLDDPDARMAQFPHQLSGGQRQRVLIALALANDPGLLIADEPTTALDAHVALRILDLLVDLSRRRGMALILISHDIAAVARATQRIMVLYGGDVVETGTTAGVLATPVHPYTRGLLAAQPRLALPAGPEARLATIAGQVPALADHAPGCRFSGRCPVEGPPCRSQRPAAWPRPDGGSALCHFAGAAT